MQNANPICTIHASTVAVDGTGVIILGASGRGKSALALELIALGGVLVADDQTRLSRKDDRLIADVPDTITGRIEARGVGILSVPFQKAVPLGLAVDLERQETMRLPHAHEFECLGITLPCLWAIQRPHFAASIMLWLKGIKSHGCQDND